MKKAINRRKFFTLTGIAALEAAYMGVPLIAIQMRSDYKPKSDDWIWSNTDFVKIADKSIELLRNPLKREALSARQTAYVKSHYTVAAMSSSYNELYLKILNRLYSVVE